MLANDNWGHRARFGMFIVGNEAVAEAEWWAMLPPHMSVHAARITARAPWASWRGDRSGVALADDLARGAGQFAAMRLNAVVVGHSSSSFLGGAGWDEAVVESLAGIVGSEMAVTTNGIDTLAALRAAGVRRPFLVLPPWFDEATVGAGLRYYEERGVAPAGHLRYLPDPEWRHLAPEALYPQGLGFAQNVEALHRQIEAACPAAADGVLIGGTGVRCVALLGSLERALGRPVLSANQCSLWHCLRLAGYSPEVSGYGRLLEPPAATTL